MRHEMESKLAKALKVLDRATPLLDDDDCESWRQSRRVPGMLTTGGDRRGYRNVHCFIEKGLGNHIDTVALVLQYVIRYQRKNGHSESRLGLACFGGIANDLSHNPMISRVGFISETLSIAKKLCALAGPDPIPTDSIALLKRLYPVVLFGHTFLAIQTLRIYWLFSERAESFE